MFKVMAVVNLWDERYINVNKRAPPFPHPKQLYEWIGSTGDTLTRKNASPGLKKRY